MIDWAPPSNDADLIDLDGKDPGTDYAFMPIPLRWINRVTTKKEPDDFPGGANYIKALGHFDDQTQAIGLMTSGTIATSLGYNSYWTELVGTKSEDDGDLWLVIKFGSGLYKRFWDTDNSTLREFCRGTFIGTDLVNEWKRDNNTMFQVAIGWKAHW